MDLEIQIRRKTKEEIEAQLRYQMSLPKCFFCGRPPPYKLEKHQESHISKWYGVVTCSYCIGMTFSYYYQHFYEDGEGAKPYVKRKRYEFMRSEQEQCALLNKLNNALKQEIRIRYGRAHG